MLEQLKNWAERSGPLFEETYRQLHDRAEESWNEYETNAYVAAMLERIGVPFAGFPDHTGLVAEWDEGLPGPTVALRADMDAVVHESGNGRKMIHSCGHDAHMTIVMHALQGLKACGLKPRGRLKLLFQPAEEKGEGALAFLRKGVIDDIDFLLGLHLRPVQELPFGQASAAIYHGSSIQLRGEIRGVQAHGARPHLGVNVADSLAAVIQAVNAVKTNPHIPGSAKVTQVSAGGAINVIPDFASFGIDLRSQTNEEMEAMLARVEQAVVSAGQANGAQVHTEVAARMVAATPNLPMEAIVGEAIRQALGAEAWSPPVVTAGAEDFHHYSSGKPGLAATMIGLGCDLSPGLHHPEMQFRLEALRHGVIATAASIVFLFDSTK